MTRRRIFRPAVVLVMAAAGATPALADPAVLTLNSSISTSYASNLFFLSPVEKTLARFPSTDDLILTPQLGAALRAPFGRQVVELKATAAYRFHRYNTQIDALDYILSAQLAYALGSACSGSLGARQERNETDYTDVLVAAGARYMVRDRTATAEMRCAVTPDIGTVASFEYRTEANSYPLFIPYDLDRTTLYGEANAGLIETGQGFGAVRYRRREQPLFITAQTPSGLSADIWDVGGGVRWSPDSDFELAAEGYWTQLRETSGKRDSTGVSAVAKAIYTLSPKTRFTFDAGTGLDVSPNIGAIAFRATSVNLQADWQPTPKIDATMQAGYVWRDILRDFAPGTASGRTRQEYDRTLNLSGSVRYHLTDRLEARLEAGYRDRRGNFEDITFRATTATIGFTYRFEGPPIDGGTR